MKHKLSIISLFITATVLIMITYSIPLACEGSEFSFTLHQPYAKKNSSTFSL